MGSYETSQATAKVIHEEFFGGTTSAKLKARYSLYHQTWGFLWERHPGSGTWSAEFQLPPNTYAIIGGPDISGGPWSSVYAWFEARGSNLSEPYQPGSSYGWIKTNNY
jgi:hypothetical protein